MVTFQNKGILAIRGLTTFGVCIKETDNPIGYFGTGLKYAIAVLLREGCKVVMHLGNNTFTFKVKKRKMRGQDIELVYMDKMELPFTTELGKNWDLWMAYRELAANAFDESEHTVSTEAQKREGYTTFEVTGTSFEKIHEVRSTIFLTDSKPAYSLEGVEVHDDLEAGKWIFYKGIRVVELPKQALYNYNILEDLKLTEDRTISSMSDVYIKIAHAIATCEHPGLIRQMLQANHQFWESQIDYHWWTVKPGEVFNRVIERYLGGHTSFNTSARSLYHRDHPRDKVPAVIMIESIPLTQRRKLWAALRFWNMLGIEFPKSIVHITTDLKQEKGKVANGHIYLSKFVLEMDMRFITGYIYKLYAQTKPQIDGVKQEDLLIDTIVEFGERVLGVNKSKVA